MNKLLSNLLILGLATINTFSGKTEDQSLPEFSEQASVDDSSTSTQPLLEDLILEEICALCEREGFEYGDPFCLTYNLRNIRADLTPYMKYLKPILDDKRTKYNQYEFCDIICHCVNLYIKDSLKISHFKLMLKSDELKNLNLINVYREKEENPSQYSIEDQYVKIKITDFKENFEIEQFKYGLDEATDNHKGIIVDLRDNGGGKVRYLQYLFSYFFNDSTILVHYITRKQEPFFGEISPWKQQLSKQELKELIDTIQINWNLEESLWEASHYKDRYPIVQKNIAILVNKNSASCSEEFTLALKSHYPDRVRVIGEKSAGRLLTSSSYLLKSFPGLLLTYPIEEIIGIDGTRVEGVGIEPDIVSNDEEKIMKTAIEWVTQESINSALDFNKN